MKKLIALLSCISMTLVGCSSNNMSITTTSIEESKESVEMPDEEKGDDTPYEYTLEFDSLDDENLMEYTKNKIYSDLVDDLNDTDYFIENVDTTYVSKEYIEELEYNSKANIFFGYTLDEIEKEYNDEQYVFTLGEDGETIVQPFESYDDTYQKVLKNVAIGTGVILVCVTVSTISGGVGAPAVSTVFAMSAKTGTIIALSEGTVSACFTGIIKGIQTGDVEESLKAAALSGSEGFMMGAFTGAVVGGATEAIALKGATLNGLTMNEAADIQKTSKYPLDVIKQFHSKEEYQVFKNAGLKWKQINGESVLINSNIDLDIVDEFGRTNLERAKSGLSMLDSTGNSYELHHIGQEANGTLAVLTQEEHDNIALHGFKSISEINRNEFAKQRKKLWKSIANMFENGEL